jgi:putative membrane protein
LPAILALSSPQRFPVDASISNHFAWFNTRQALERTLMAWIRTAVSLISFGFTIVQFFQRFSVLQGPAERPISPGAPRVMGLALIGIGILTLIVGSWQYRQSVKYMWQPQFRAIAGLSEQPHRTPTFFAALVLMLIGLFAFFSVFFRLA